MPLDAAIFVSSLDKIFACRGPYIYEMSADTGAKVSEAKVKPVWGASCLEWDSTRNILYWAGFYDIGFRYVTAGSSTKTNINVIQKINPADLSVTGEIPNACNNTEDFGGQIGVTALKYNSVHDTLLYAYGSDLNATAPAGRASELNEVSPAAVSLNYSTPATNISSCDVHDISYDSANDRYYYVSAYGFVYLCEWDGFFYSELDNVRWEVAQPNLDPTGVSIDTASGEGWYATGTRYVLSFTYAGINPTPTVHDIGDAAAQPQRIRFNPNDSIMYLPSMNDNKVYTLDPATGLFGPSYSGFDCPFDVVFTASKVFAVQRGKQGLKEVV